jgi:hypothetical protein
MDAITARVRKGQSDAEISQGLGGQLGKRLDNNVDADLVNEVADKILMDATAKVRAQATAAGGADTLAGQRQLKFARNEAAEKARTGREAASGYEQSLAQQMFQESGGQLGQQGAMAAAHRAMQNMKEGQSEQQAAWNAMLATIEDLEREAAHARAGMAGVNQRLNRLQAQGRRNRAQKPGLLPFFPQ